MAAYSDNSLRKRDKSFNEIMRILKIVAINLLVFLIAAIVMAEGVALVIKYMPRENDAPPQTSLPNYADAPWLSTFLKEYKKSFKVEYMDYVVWRRKSFSGETINVGADGRRRSYQPTVTTSRNFFAFYGGSTMWGDGNRDQETIPSVFAAQNQVNVENNGEGGYIARQSLAWMVNAYITERHDRKRVVVFYDGVNDVVQRCWKENKGISTYHEKEFGKKIEGAYTYWILNVLPFKNYVDRLLKDFGRLSEQPSAFDCADNPERARQVARTLIETWMQAQYLAASQGDEFLAVLQPVSHVGSPNLSHLPYVARDRTHRGREYIAVYAAIQAMMKDYPTLSFVDLSRAYDGVDFYYIDYSHVSPNAHRTLVKKLSMEMRARGLL